MANATDAKIMKYTTAILKNVHYLLNLPAVLINTFMSAAASVRMDMLESVELVSHALNTHLMIGILMLVFVMQDTTSLERILNFSHIKPKIPEVHSPATLDTFIVRMDHHGELEVQQQ
jgi:hypothetical protein